MDLPSEEVARTALKTEVRAVGLSVSLANDGPECTHQLQALRAVLPERVDVLVGGLGARAACRGLRDVRMMGELQDLERWAREAVSRRDA